MKKRIIIVCAMLLAGVVLAYGVHMLVFNRIN